MPPQKKLRNDFDMWQIFFEILCNTLNIAASKVLQSFSSQNATSASGCLGV
jgi:hypothetical protein